MLRKLLASAAATALVALGASAPAHAAQYITQLEYDSNGLHVPSYGTVTVTELDANTVDVLVDFGSLVDKIVDTGNGHVAFAFNLVDSPNSTVSFVQPTTGFTYTGEYVPSGKKNDPGGWTMSPFGHFNNAIDCCGNGASNGILPPLEFKVENTSGITFVGAGNHFTSNSDGTVGGFTGGWWFAVDTFDASRPDGANTYAVAGRDYCTVGVDCSNTVPEPATWALMIMGFGGAGAMIRRRRTVLA